MTLAELRKQRGLTQRELAKALGLSHGAIGNYEAGIATPNLRTARRIARFFGVRLDDLRFAGEEEPTGDRCSGQADEPEPFARGEVAA